jgi:hypothetical protein
LKPEASEQTVERFSLCLALTHNAAKGINRFANGSDLKINDGREARRRAEAYLRELLGIGNEYFYYLRQEDDTDRLSISLVLGTDQDEDCNRKILDKTSGKTLIINGIDKGKEFVVTAFRVVPQTYGSYTPDSLPAYVKLYFPGTISYFDKDEIGFPSLVKERIVSLRESYKSIVEKRLRDWYAFLDFQEKITKEKQYMVKYDEYRESKNPHVLIFKLSGPAKQLPWDKIKAEQEIHLVISKETDPSTDGFSYETIGTIEEVSDKKMTLTVKLTEELYKRLSDLNSGYRLPPEGFLFYKPQWDESEIRKQRKGLERLQNGQAQNRNLIRFIFDPMQAGVNLDSEKIALSPENMLLKSLNQSQIKAVEGALNCQDLFLIKGPPGTGKTTVIAEICYQLAKQGKRVLIASQTNLAVDNAISKIVHDPSIRVLRVGREGGIEQEGLKFIEGEVVKTWLQNTAEFCKKRMQKLNNTARRQ